MKPNQNQTAKNLRKTLNYVFAENPVLAGGLALAPAVIGSFTLKNGVGLSLVFAVATIPVLFLASILGRFLPKVPQYAKMMIYASVAALLLIPARFLAQGIAPNLFDSLGMYFSMVALNTVWLVRAPRCQSKKPLPALWEGICLSLGFAFCVCAVSFVRELLAYGTIWGNATMINVKFPAVGYSFAGFIVVGVVAAVVRWAIDRSKDIVKISHQQKQKWEGSR